MKRFFCLVLTIVLLFIMLVGCGIQIQQTENDYTKKSGKPVKVDKDNKANQQKTHLIACIVNQDDQYMKLLQLGMSDEADKLGVDIILANTYGKLDKEIELINTYIKSGVDGICIHPVSEDLSVPILNKAITNGVKVISAGIAIDDKYHIGYIENDQWELGKKTGEACRDFVEKNLNGKANIAILNYKSQFAIESNKRTEAFKSEVTKLPEVKIILEQDNAWLYESAAIQARNIIASQPGLDIIWAANEGGTYGAVIAVKNSGKAGKIFVFGTDVSEQLLNMLLSEDNILQAVTGQQPYEIGKQSLEQLVNEINGEQTNFIRSIHGIPLSRNNQNEVRSFVEDFKKMIGAK